MAEPIVVAEVVRNGFIEGHHRGSWVVLDADGEVIASAGVVAEPILPRSCNKPIQALGMVRSGLALDGELLALACASHSGEDFHIEGVRRILDGAGLTPEALQTPPDYPLNDAARDEAIRSGAGKQSIFMNCSGKHAGMLATCVANGWPIENYLDPDHPLQVAIAKTFAELTGEPIVTVAVDGCGAPLLSTSLTGLARAFSRLATSAEPEEQRIASAIRAFPAYVSGTQREELTLLQAIPGSIGKAGAEACYAVALADGRAVACKIDDGSQRARPGLMAALLEKYVADSVDEIDLAGVRRSGEQPLYGGGHVVGEVRPIC